MKAILAIGLLLLLLCAAEAKEPKVGDLVSVVSSSTIYEGKIIGLSDGMMCIAARMAEANDSWLCKDVCFGYGQISRLFWINQTGSIEK